jgi:RNA polymerase sigma-70 factor (ECF subfamily)
VRHYARALVGHAGFTASDQDDIEQELRLDILQRLPKYDPAKSKRATFITRVIEHKTADLIRHHRAESRALNVEVRSLEGEVATEEGIVWLGDLITREDMDRRLRCDARTIDEAGLRLDLAEASARAPKDLQQLCEDLRTKSINEIADERKTTRFAVYRRLCRLRAWLEKRAIQEYLKSTRTCRRSATYERNRDSVCPRPGVSAGRAPVNDSERRMLP